jgi:hypothetical protein
MLLRLRISGLLAVALCAALIATSVALACPSGGGGSASASATAAAKKCKAGYHRVTVTKHGKKTKVCKKIHYTQQG